MNHKVTAPSRHCRRPSSLRAGIKREPGSRPLTDRQFNELTALARYVLEDRRRHLQTLIEALEGGPESTHPRANHG